MIGKNPTTRLADQLIPSPYPDTDPAGSGQGFNEISLMGGDGPQGFTALSVATFAITDTATIYIPTRVKSIYIQTFNSIAWVGAGQSVVRLYSGRTRQATVRQHATASQLNVGHPADEGYAGAAPAAYQANFGASGTGLPNQGWWFTAADIPALQWPLAYVGVEIAFFAAPTVGSVAVAIYGQAA